MPNPARRARITVVGIGGDNAIPPAAGALLDSAELIVGGERLLDAVASSARRRLAINGNLDSVLDRLEAEPGRVCVLASGDPGFFGIVRSLTERFGPEQLDVHPAPSSVSLAFARLGLPWDDATVVSAHGRPLAGAARAAAASSKVAVLTSPDSPPEALGRALLQLGARYERVAVCSRLGAPDEGVDEVDLAGLASRTWDPLSVVVLLRGETVAPEPTLAWGLPDATFAHRGGMVTKAEIRAVVLGKLTLTPTGVLWDVGAGSGSVAIECARLAPQLHVIAIEVRREVVEQLRANVKTHGVRVDVVEGSAPAVFDSLPAPDRVFVGGGGVSVLEAARRRLAPGGQIVATYAALDRAAQAFTVLGHMVQLSLSRAGALPDGGARLAAENPVFVAWGPDA